MALRFSDQDSTLWHDLGMNLFLQSFIHLKLAKGTKFDQKDADVLNNDQKEILERSLKALKTSVSMDANNENAWNTLGVVAYYYGEYAACLTLKPCIFYTF